MNRQQVEALKAMAALMEPNCRAVLEDAIEWIEFHPLTADGHYVKHHLETLWRWTKHKKPRLQKTCLLDCGYASECYKDHSNAEQATTKGDQPATASDKHKER
jgi:hypothetical protein